MLPYAAYSAAREVSPANRELAGRQVFLLACTRCHTTAGVNSVIAKLRALYGPPPWDRDTVKAYLKTMHNVRTYMPPFPGSDEEAGALADYLVRLPGSATPLEGAQSAGIPSAVSSSGRTGVERAVPAAPDGA